MWVIFVECENFAVWKEISSKAKCVCIQKLCKASNSEVKHGSREKARSDLYEGQRDNCEGNVLSTG